jgi:hypothetical protein
MSAINVCPGGDLNVIARCRLACLVAAPLWALTAGSALAVDQVHDEIQVYNANINDVGQWSYEQHLNFAVIGQKQPEFPGGFTSNRSLQGTPEFAYGITNWWEVGFYLPFGVSGSGEFLSNGTKLRSLFAVPDAGKRSFFYGVNFELSYEMPQFAATPWNMEIRPIIGVRNKEWEFIINPIVDIGFGPGGEADVAPAARQDRQFPTAAAAEPTIVRGHRFQSERRRCSTRRRLWLHSGIGSADFQGHHRLCLPRAG